MEVAIPILIIGVIGALNAQEIIATGLLAALTAIITTSIRIILAMMPAVLVVLAMIIPIPINN